MFCPLEYRDTLIVFRGLLILVVVILLGVSVTEQQLNSLTQREDCVHAFNITYNHNGVYSIYILGSSYNMSAVYSVGEIINTDKVIIIKTTNHRVTIPTYIEIDCKKELVLLDLLAMRLVEESFKLKQTLHLYINEIHQKLNVYIRQLR